MKDGRTAMHAAAANDSQRVLSVLLAARAGLEGDKDGLTPLHFASLKLGQGRNPIFLPMTRLECIVSGFRDYFVLVVLLESGVFQTPRAVLFLYFFFLGVGWLVGWFGLVWFGLLCFGLVWFGLVWFAWLVGWLVGWLVAWLRCCVVALLLGCLVAWLLGCLVAWLLGCLVAWLLGCLVAWLT